MLKLGKSKPWPEALEKLTGSKKMDVGPLKEYFEPLNKWMKQQREKYEYPLGWTKEEVTTDAPAGVGAVVPTFLTLVGAMFLSLAYML